MPATVPTRGVLKISQNRVRTSVALQGNNMWENVIGIVNEDRGANEGVEALINAPKVGGGRQASQARRAAAAEAVRATGGFDTAVTDYTSLLNLAKSQGAVGGSNRGACKVCGQLGHLTKQCRNQFSKFYSKDDAVAPEHAAGTGSFPQGDAHDTDSSLSSILADSSDSDLSSSSSDDRKKRKDKKRKRSSKSSKDKKHKKKKSKKEKKSKKSKKRRRDTSSSSDSD